MSDQEDRSPRPDNDDLDPIEAMLLKCVQGPRDSWDACIETMCRKHQDLADALRRAYAIFRGLRSGHDQQRPDRTDEADGT